MSRLVIRPATSDDWDALLPLLRSMGSQTGEQARQRFAVLACHDDHYLPVADAGEALVGYGWVQDYGPHLRSGDRTARLHDLFVSSDHRRRGSGALLFEALKTWAERRGVRYLEWQASQAALPFYAHLGYTGDPCPQPEYPFFEVTTQLTSCTWHLTDHNILCFSRCNCLVLAVLMPRVRRGEHNMLRSNQPKS